MRKIVNPFIVTGKIDPAYFCDREEESARLIRSLDNEKDGKDGINSVLL